MPSLPSLLQFPSGGGGFYDATPLTQPSTRSISRVNPGYRYYWALHGRYFWYITPSPEHYHCHKTYIGKNKNVSVIHFTFSLCTSKLLECPQTIQTHMTPSTSHNHSCSHRRPRHMNAFVMPHLLPTMCNRLNSHNIQHSNPQKIPPGVEPPIEFPMQYSTKTTYLKHSAH